jgi:hypothetical protein
MLVRSMTRVDDVAYRARLVGAEWRAAVAEVAECDRLLAQLTKETQREA